MYNRVSLCPKGHLVVAAILILVAAFLYFGQGCGSINAGDEVAVGIEVVDETSDMIGSRIVYYVRETIRNSEGYYLAGTNQNRLVLRITSIDPHRDVAEEKGRMTAISYTWTMGYEHNEYCYCFFSQNIGYCGSDRVKEMAEAIVSEADGLLAEFWELVYEWYKARYPDFNLDSALNSDST